MSCLKILCDSGVSLELGGLSPLDLELAPVSCLKTEGLHRGAVPTVPRRSGVPTLLLLSPTHRPLFGGVFRHSRRRLDLLSESLRHPGSCKGEPDSIVVRLVLQARLSSGRVSHVRGDKEPVELPTHLPLGVRRGGPVVGRRPNNRVSPSQGNGELIRFEVPVTTYDVGMISKSVDMRKHLVENAPVPLAGLRV
eukprot:1369141-Amphidinium_carterae.4